MRADGEQKNRLGARMLHDFKNDAEVVTGAGRPAPCHIAFDLVGSQSGIKRIRFKFGQNVTDRTDGFRRLLMNRLAARMNPGDLSTTRFKTESRASDLRRLLAALLHCETRTLPA